MHLILIGAPGSGKGMQGDLLAAKLGVPHISTGSIIRHIGETGEAAGLRYKKLIDSGNFIPDSDMVAIVTRRLGEVDAAGGYILDGFPRDMTQAQLFDATDFGRRLDSAVELIVDEAVLIERLEGRLVCPVCGATYHARLHPPVAAGVCDRDSAQLVRRADDGPDSVKHRLSVYHARTEPIVDHYRAQGRLISVDASAAPEEVFRRLMRLLFRDPAQSPKT